VVVEYKKKTGIIWSVLEDVWRRVKLISEEDHIKLEGEISWKKLKQLKIWFYCIG
jgi:hypothetical protein